MKTDKLFEFALGSFVERASCVSHPRRGYFYKKDCHGAPHSDVGTILFPPHLNHRSGDV